MNLEVFKAALQGDEAEDGDVALREWLQSAIKIVKIKDESDAKNGDRFLARIKIGDANHHMEFIRVIEEEDGQMPENDEYQGTYDDLQVLYAGKYQVIEIPGLPGRYIVYMHPYED